MIHRDPDHPGDPGDPDDPDDPGDPGDPDDPDDPDDPNGSGDPDDSGSLVCTRGTATVYFCRRKVCEMITSFVAQCLDFARQSFRTSRSEMCALAQGKASFSNVSN